MSRLDPRLAQLSVEMLGLYRRDPPAPPVAWLARVDQARQLTLDGGGVPAWLLGAFGATMADAARAHTDGQDPAPYLAVAAAIIDELIDQAGGPPPAG